MCGEAPSGPASCQDHSGWGDSGSKFTAVSAQRDQQGSPYTNFSSSWSSPRWSCHPQLRQVKHSDREKGFLFTRESCSVFKVSSCTLHHQHAKLCTPPRTLSLCFYLSSRTLRLILNTKRKKNHCSDSALVAVSTIMPAINLGQWVAAVDLIGSKL